MKIGIIIVGLLLSISVNAATNADIDTEAWAVVSNYNSFSYNSEQMTWGETVYLPLYTDVDDDFSNYNINQEGNYISVNLPGYNSGSTYYGECVTFVKAMSSDVDVHTSNWTSNGNSITTVNMPSVGDIIATFDNNNKYDFGHVAIVVRVTGNYVHVMDQNYVDNVLTVHELHITGNGNISDLGNYRIVQI